MMQAYQDAMVIVQNKGIAYDFFTFTCNSNWQEIIAKFEPNQIASDRLDCISDEGESPF
jgi:hypothetical protein